MSWCEDDKVLEVLEYHYYEGPLCKVSIVLEEPGQWNKAGIVLRIEQWKEGSPVQYELEDIAIWHERLKYWQQAFDEGALEEAIGLFELSKESK